MSLLKNLLKGTDWENVTEYLSPVFFQVVPPLKMTRRVAALARSSVDRTSFAKAREQAASLIHTLQLPIEVASEFRDPQSALDPAHGSKLLALYFGQILQAKTVLLDLRPSAFSQSDGQLIWVPSSLHVFYDTAFGNSLSELYRGFYSNDDERFRRALEFLSLEHAEELFREHFGESQTSMTFSLQDFKRTFHNVFMSCKVNRTSLHPDFLALGAGLYCLYSHLEALGGSYNVRESFLVTAERVDHG